LQCLRWSISAVYGCGVHRARSSRGVTAGYYRSCPADRRYRSAPLAWPGSTPAAGAAQLSRRGVFVVPGRHWYGCLRRSAVRAYLLSLQITVPAARPRFGLACWLYSLYCQHVCRHYAGDVEEASGHLLPRRPGVSPMPVLSKLAAGSNAGAQWRVTSRGQPVPSADSPCILQPAKWPA